MRSNGVVVRGEGAKRESGFERGGGDGGVRIKEEERKKSGELNPEQVEG